MVDIMENQNLKLKNLLTFSGVIDQNEITKLYAQLDIIIKTIKAKNKDL